MADAAHINLISRKFPCSRSTKPAIFIPAPGVKNEKPCLTNRDNRWFSFVGRVSKIEEKKLIENRLR